MANNLGYTFIFSDTYQTLKEFNMNDAPFFELPNNNPPINYPQQFKYPSKDTMPK